MMNFRHITKFIDDEVSRTDDPEKRAHLREIEDEAVRMRDGEKADYRTTIPDHLLETIRARFRAIGVELPLKFPIGTKARWYCEDTM